MPKEAQYKVTDKNGLIGFNNRKYALGDIVDGEPNSHIRLWLRFKQIEEVEAGTKEIEQAGPVPTIEEVVAAGYSASAAKKIVKKAQAEFDAAQKGGE